MSNPNERQVAGTHYAGVYQHWDYVRRALENRYLEGCASKYVARCRKKNGAQDLEKAIHYLEKIKFLFQSGAYEHPNENTMRERMREAYTFIDAQGIKWEDMEAGFLVELTHWATTADLDRLVHYAHRLIEELRR
jgi:hypothetical protein